MLFCCVCVRCWFLRVVACLFFFFSSRRRHTRYWRDWSSDVCSSDLELRGAAEFRRQLRRAKRRELPGGGGERGLEERPGLLPGDDQRARRERLPDHRDDLHVDAQAAQGQSAIGRSAELLPLGAEERAAAGAEARLRTASARAGRPD